MFLSPLEPDTPGRPGSNSDFVEAQITDWRFGSPSSLHLQVAKQNCDRSAAGDFVSQRELR
jgi:hypothetical protein